MMRPAILKMMMMAATHLSDVVISISSSIVTSPMVNSYSSNINKKKHHSFSNTRLLVGIIPLLILLIINNALYAHASPAPPPPPPQTPCSTSDLPPNLKQKKGSCLLKTTRHKILSRKEYAPLFDTQRYANDFERAIVFTTEINNAHVKPMHVVVAKKPVKFLATRNRNDEL